MAKSALYAVNSIPQILAVGDRISFGAPVRRFGCNINIADGTPYLVGQGYYSLDTNFNFTADAAGTATITLLKDGTPIPGANASITVAAATDYQISVPAVVRQFTDSDSNITAVLTGAAGTITGATVYIDKL